MSPWQIWIDTGGTFTDCIAHTPGGKTERLKLLSSSVLRGRIIKRHGDKSLKVEMSWPVSDDLFHDFEFRIVGTTFKSSIQRIDVSENVIHVADSLPKVIGGHVIEVTSNEEVPVLAARLLTRTSLSNRFPEIEMRLGSTRGTNAILERKGARTALLITSGFKDLLLIGNQQRPDLFALHVVKTMPLYDCAVEIDERIDSSGIKG